MHTDLDYKNVYLMAERIKSYSHRAIDFVFANPIVALISALAIFIILNTQVLVLISAYVAMKMIDFLATPITSSTSHLRMDSIPFSLRPEMVLS